MSAGHVYVIAFDNGTVKIGRTKNVPKRLSDHQRDGRKFCIEITDTWASPLHDEWEPNENALKSIAVKHGGKPARPGSEYFTGANYARVVRAARRLIFTSPNGSGKRSNGPVPVDPRKVWMKRIRAGLCAIDLARLTGLSAGYIRLIERGKREPSAKALDTLAKTFGCDITDLMPDVPVAEAA